MKRVIPEERILIITPFEDVIFISDNDINKTYIEVLSCVEISKDVFDKFFYAEGFYLNLDIYKKRSKEYYFDAYWHELNINIIDGGRIAINKYRIESFLDELEINEKIDILDAKYDSTIKSSYYKVDNLELIKSLVKSDV